MPGQVLTPGIGDDQGGAAFRRVLEEGRGYRVVLRRARADHENAVRIGGGGEGGGDRARSDAFQQRGHRAGVAEPGAVIDIVGAEPGADEFLEQVGLLVRSLGGAEAGQGRSAMVVAQPLEPGRGGVERLVPARLAKMAERVRRVDLVVPAFRGVRLADQRPRQAMAVMDIVETEAPLHAEPVPIGRAVPAVDRNDLLVLDVEGDLAADTAIGAQAGDLPVGRSDVALRSIQHRSRHQCAGRAGLHALSAGDAGRRTHGVAHVEDDRRVRTASGHADHVVHLNLAAGADAQGAVDAGVQVDRHRRVAVVRRGRGTPREAAIRDAQRIGPPPESGRRVVRVRSRRLVGDEQFHDHAPGVRGALAGRSHDHAVGRRSDTGGREDALAVDLHHAGAAVAVRPVARFGAMAEVWNFYAHPIGDLPDGFAGLGVDRRAVERETNGFIRCGHCLQRFRKMAEQRQHGVCRGLSETAYRRIGHSAAEVFQQRLVPVGAAH